MHVILDHFLDYVILTGNTLGETSDEVIESLHQQFKKTLDNSNYKVKNKNTEGAGKKLLKAVLHRTSKQL